MAPTGPHAFGGSGAAPRRARVVPRVRTSADGAALPLEHHVRGLLRAGARGWVNLFGPPGSGKTVALEHVALALPDEPSLVLQDRNAGPTTDPPRDALVLFTSHERAKGRMLVSLEMAPWTDDDLIEYLVGTHRERIAAVMRRVHGSPDRGMLGGLPELWRIVLDVLAADDAVPDVSAALRWFIDLELPREDARAIARRFALYELTRSANLALPTGWLDAFTPGVGRLMRHRCVQLPLAAELCVDAFALPGGTEGLTLAMPTDLFGHVAARVRGQFAALSALERLATDGPKRQQATAISLLHAAGAGWRPDPRAGVPNLIGARLSRAAWAGVDLTGCWADDADLSGADLTAARLDDARLRRANLQGAKLRHASVQSAQASGADFSAADLTSANLESIDLSGAVLIGADLRSANLTSARLYGADLRGARLGGARLCRAALGNAQIEDADLGGADLTGAALPGLNLRAANLARACFAKALVVRCCLEYVTIEQADFRGALLIGTLLTGSTMPGANFHGAALREAGLADIAWPGADLGDADLTGASFHAGSTRSGLVGSTIPCEGSRTGFYTDDFNDRDFKAPEEIRKANLCGADLRGAKIDGVDFYLVDLRGARYTREQAERLCSCGAILNDP